MHCSARHCSVRRGRPECLKHSTNYRYEADAKHHSVLKAVHSRCIWSKENENIRIDNVARRCKPGADRPACERAKDACSPSARSTHCGIQNCPIFRCRCKSSAAQKSKVVLLHLQVCLHGVARMTSACTGLANDFDKIIWVYVVNAAQRGELTLAVPSWPPVCSVANFSYFL